MQVKRKIILSGEMADLFGREFNLAVNTPAETISALCSLRKGFKEYMRRKGAHFRFLINNRDVKDFENECGIKYPHNSVFAIVPVIRGSKKNGLGQFLVGLTMIVASAATMFFTGGTVGGRAFGASMASTFGTTAAGVSTAGVSAGTVYAAGLSAEMGAMLAVGGVAQMLTPTIKLGGFNASDDSVSSLFNGAVNTISQGAAKPVLYGRVKIGSATISEGLSNQDVPAQ